MQLIAGTPATATAGVDFSVSWQVHNLTEDDVFYVSEPFNITVE